MSYQVIARKWRPQKFSDMVGQEHLARTLKNAIMSGRIAHAYLFVGPRGIGKTTTARIFAKAMNCLHPIDGEPCCQCSSCKSIADESNVDVIEIDAATHTQVEKARELCEDVLHLPISSKFKIYIIDEVHMLSKNAWNALLKTIEEPPAHAKFIFATTEVNKVLPTVISRCQRFDLRRIKGTDIAGRLRLICDAENVKITDGALQIIARAADGGMRDAQSLLDQMISFFGSESGGITEEQALSLFGLAASADMESLVRSIVTNDRAAAIEAIHRFAESGKNLETLYEEIIAWLRGILMCRIVSDPAKLLEESQEKIDLYQNIAATVKPDAVQRLMEQLAGSGYLLREAINKQVFMESLLLKAMRIAHAVQIEDLIARLNQLRNAGEFDAVKSLVPIYEMPVGQIVVPKDSTFAPRSNAAIETKVVSADSIPVIPEKKTLVTEPVAESKAEPEVVPSAPEPVSEPDKDDQPPFDPDPIAEDAPVIMESTPTEAAEEIVTEPVREDVPLEVIMEEEVIELNDDAAPIPEDPESLASLTKPAAVQTPEQIWQELIIDVRDNLRKDFLAIAMNDGSPLSYRRNSLTVAFDPDYEAFQGTTTEKELQLLTSRLRAISGEPGANLFIEYRQGLATPLQISKKEDVEKLKEKAAADPLVQDTLDLFHGHLADAHSAGQPAEL
ncbi:MAG: DNA polymerase III subunit gamma/tau [Lentisphaeria bacterium]|nr:DNA polymerase III subunit gamma/tau [Lentisphaeria bacterium]MBO5695492.1 DNA polymerase III subunit gamma/tau [Lentisphaeria bacterium]MBR4884129.1 DNA polymerase III subunit gamma/tau [Lentisphaeria bacterium]